MNKKLNFLIIIPVWGACILIIKLLIESHRGEIVMKKFTIFFYSLMLVVFLSSITLIIIGAILIQNFNLEFLSKDPRRILSIIEGYIVNIYSFIFVNRKWDWLHKE